MFKKARKQDKMVVGMKNFYYAWGVSMQAFSQMKNQKICQALANDVSDIQAIMSITPQENTDDSKVQ